MTDNMLEIYTEVCLKGKYFKEQYTEPTHEKVKNYLKENLKKEIGTWMPTNLSTMDFQIWF